MNYKRIYDEIISNAKNRITNKGDYFEKHHIIPKFDNGSNDKDNLVRLTAREHFIAHLLLMKIYKTGKAYFAFKGMCNWKSSKQMREYKINSHLYSSAKGKYKHEPETILKIKEGNIGKRLSKEHKNKISMSRKIGYEDGSIEKPIGEKNGMYGKKLSEESRLKISIARTGKKVKDTSNWNKSGLNNPQAKIIHIFNEHDVLMFISNGEFRQTCKDNDLPYCSLGKSYNKNGERIFMSKAGEAQALKNNNIQYKGWYAKII